jgi:hypothetical protein
MGIQELVQWFCLAESGVDATGPAKWVAANPYPFILLLLGLLFGFILLTDPRRKISSPGDGKATDSGNGSDARLRNDVAMTVLIGSISGIVLLGALVIIGVNRDNTANIFNAVLPVFGTWVGTLLAYYFGKDNFESGAQHSANLAREFAGIQKLRSIQARSVMIPFDKIEIPPAVKDKPESEYINVPLLAVINTMTRERLPLFVPVTQAIRAVLHKSLINEFLVKQATMASPPRSFEAVTLQDLLNDADAKKSAETFVVLPNTATLADVKERMTAKSLESQPSCEDAFITAPNSPAVQGWITSDIIDQNSKA